MNLDQFIDALDDTLAMTRSGESRDYKAARLTLESMINVLITERNELRSRFTSTGKMKLSGDPVLDACLRGEDPEFEAAIKALPETHWSRYDLSAVRIGWELAKKHG